MRNLFLGSLSALLVGVGLAAAQPTASLPSPRTVAEPEVPAPAALEAAPVPAPVFLDVPPPAPQTPMGPAIHVAPGMCGDLYHLWFSGEYLMWWMRQNEFPPLLTVGPATSLGLLGSPGTVALGGQDLDNREHSGARFTIGGWATDFKGFGIEGSVFFLESKSFDFGGAGTGQLGSPVVARPFFNVLTGREDAKVIAFPGIQAGSVGGTTFGECTGSSRLWGVEGNLIANCCCDWNYRFDLLIGFRYLSLQDRFSITDSALTSTGASASTLDQFNTNNSFYGGQVGARLEWYWNRLTFQMRGKVAAGQTNEVLDVGGVTTLFTPGTLPLTVTGGFLATGNNIGRFTCDKFAVVPEVGINAGYRVCDCLQVFAGYTFLYWSDVARSGDQINRNVNVLGVPAIAGPNPAFVLRPVSVRSTDFWAHGLNVGFELRY